MSIYLTKKDFWDNFDYYNILQVHLNVMFFYRYPLINNLKKISMFIFSLCQSYKYLIIISFNMPFIKGSLGPKVIAE
jgi:hypothetical protein